MLQKTIPFIFLAVALAFVPKFIDDQKSSPAAQSSDERAEKRAVKTTTSGKKPHYVSGVRLERIRASRDGHFYSKFRANGRVINGLIDTGATHLAMSESTARSIGIKISPSDYKYKANTANGVTKAAKMKLDRMEIGSISISDVSVFILKDTSLSTTLIGMSFLSKLKSFSIMNGELVLTN